jgi:hypothetical protein
MSEDIQSGPPVEVGKKLEGLKSGGELRGKNYWDQVVDSEFGPLHHSKVQWRDGKSRWETVDGDIMVVVDVSDQTVVEIIK